MQILYYKSPMERVVRCDNTQPTCDYIQQYCSHCDKWIPTVSWWYHKKWECAFQPDVGLQLSQSTKSKWPDFRASAPFLFAAIGGMFGCFIPWLGVILLIIGFTIPLVLFKCR